MVAAEGFARNGLARERKISFGPPAAKFPCLVFPWHANFPRAKASCEGFARGSPHAASWASHEAASHEAASHEDVTSSARRLRA